jgi:hypothetical protein
MHPKRWTAITWLGIFLWLWGPISLNRLPASYWTENAGQWEQTVISSPSEMPFPIGWPLHYVVPDDPSSSIVPQRVGAVIPPPGPAWISYVSLAINLFLIAAATAAMVYCSQTLIPKFSLKAIFVITLLVALDFGVLPRVAQLFGVQVSRFLSDAIYFLPIAGVIAIPTLRKFDVDWAAAIPTIKSLGSKTVDYEDPDEVLAHASRLNRQGRWDEAIKIYRAAASQWPQQATYIGNCIAEIEEKKST